MLPSKENNPFVALLVFWDFFSHFLLPHSNVISTNLIVASAIFLSDLNLYREIWSTFPHVIYTKPYEGTWNKSDLLLL